MQIKISQLPLIVIITLGIFVLPPITLAPAMDTQVAPPIITITPKVFLEQEIKQQGLTDRDFTIMTEIIQCESNWSQVWERDFKNGRKKGEVKVSNGNIGLAQINKWVHQKEYTELKLDPYKEFDNLTYAVILYKRNGVRDWEQLSGWCWKPVLEKKGILFGIEALAGQDGGQCVAFIQNLFNIYDKFKGKAADIQPNIDTPAVGIVVLTSEGEVGHAAYIYKIKDSELYLAESNWHNDEKITVGRRLAINSSVIRGYFTFNN
jgi:hypothetical protein